MDRGIVDVLDLHPICAEEPPWAHPVVDLPGHRDAVLADRPDPIHQMPLPKVEGRADELENVKLVVAIEAENVYDFSEEMSEPIAAAVPIATQEVLALL